MMLIKMAASVEILFKCKVYRKDGTLKKDYGWKKSNCFVLQFLQILHTVWQAGAIAGVKDVGGVNRTIPWTATGSSTVYSIMYLAGPSNQSLYGIVVGTGTDAEANNDHKLATQIAHGAGGGQFLHGSQGFTEPEIVGANVEYYLERTFTNGSGGSITVEEVGIYTKLYDTGQVFRYFCIIRDLTGGVVVDSGEVLTVEYCWRTTV